MENEEQTQEQEPSTLVRIVLDNLPGRKVIKTLPGPALYPTVKELTQAQYGEELNGES